MSLVDDFKTRFPVFAESVVDQYIPILEPVYPAYFVGGDYNDATDKEAILNLLAHLLVLETSSGSGAGAAGGTVASKSVGNVSISYAQPKNQSANADFFNGTKYGARFLMIVKGRGGTARWV